jgi:ApbE superfamily uncharacterized protein (UPF0280 family)
MARYKRTIGDFLYGRPIPFKIGPYAIVTGTITASTVESDIVNGGKTIIITLTNDTWIADITAQRQNIINGLDSAQSEANGWNNEVRDKQGVAGVVRTSDTVVTITLDAQAAYNITANETITVTVPSTAVNGSIVLTATPTFQVAFFAAGGADWPLFQQRGFRNWRYA